MCDRGRRVFVRAQWLAGWILRPLVPLLVAGVASLARAQDVAALAARADSMTARAADAQRDLRAARTADLLLRTDTLHAHGFTVVLFRAALGERDRARLGEGLARGREAVRRQWGTDAAALIDSAGWQVTGSVRPLALVRPLGFSVGRSGDGVGTTLVRPIDPAAVARLVERRAGTRIVRAVAALGAFHGTDIPAAHDVAAFALASRELATASSAPARRCQRGSVADCRRILVPPPESLRLVTWFDPPDHREIVARQVTDLGPADAERQALRRQCENQDAAACTTLVLALPVLRDPVSVNVRATFVSNAIGQLDSAAFARLRAAPPLPERDVIATLAGALDVSEDALIADWHHRTRAALDHERPSSAGILAASAAWALALLGVATLRRQA